ncbi:Endo/exonuclease/phosphatase domain-containing protein [Aphis craccivora]|uniref:Endo/exonuclease/phosphatase domain-containing protein n=1 Tax=Aphis craccivora TaxID=307492 RepID=A0A6G0YYU6_APHCR|nr:Endo/exonuclease/phosphatase domain-containing protein [Aphis craccivora]
MNTHQTTPSRPIDNTSISTAIANQLTNDSLSLTEHSTQPASIYTNTNMNFAMATATENTPSREQAIMFNSIDGISQIDYIIAIEINHLKAGINMEGYGHIMSFRRQVYITHEDIPKLPNSMLITHNDNQFRTFLTDDTLTCFLCKVVCHTSNNCKKNSETYSSIEPIINTNSINVHFNTNEIQTTSTDDDPHLSASNSQPDEKQVPTITDWSLDTTLLSEHNEEPPSTQTQDDTHKRPISNSSSLKLPDYKTTLTLIIKYPQTPRSNSSNRSYNSNLDEHKKPIEKFFTQNDNLPISYLQFLYILENFTNKSINIHSLTKEVNIENIIHQLQQPFIIVGDFNSHNPIWGSHKTDTRGKIIEELLTQDNLVSLNTGQPTRINPSDGKFFTIDLSISNTSLVHNLEWKVLPDIFSSDHIPIQITFTCSSNRKDLFYPPRWKVKETNWNLLNSLIENNNQTDPSVVWSKIISLKEPTSIAIFNFYTTQNSYRHQRKWSILLENIFKKIQAIKFKHSNYEDEFLINRHRYYSPPNTIDPNDTTQILINSQITMENWKWC